jgi:hypothetical protein
MATLSEKIQTAITSQQAEVDRLTHIATVDLPAAQTKLTNLQSALTRITPQFETNLNTLKSLGISLDN